MSLDPEDWSAVQVLGRRMVDDMIDAMVPIITDSNSSQR